jgi:hypothetical protein
LDTRALIDRTKLWLNFNDSQSDQDFTEAQILSAINMAYSEECSKAKQEGLRRWFRASTEFTWEADEVTYTLPSALNRISLFRLVDVTSDAEPGTQLLFSEEGSHGDIFFKDRNTLRWGSTGPNEDKTIRAYYFAAAEELSEDTDVPELVPDEFHELIPLSAAILLRGMAEEIPPPWWLEKQREYRYEFWKFISRGRPLDDIPSVEMYEGDLDGGFI